LAKVRAESEKRVAGGKLKRRNEGRGSGVPWDGDSTVRTK
jgi:hypothetical protein